MEEEVESILDEMARCDRAFSALYREAARAFGLSEAAMWALYAVESADGPVSQRELARAMGLSKQTVNSAVASLANRGVVELRVVPGTRNRKDILLTEAGAELAALTVSRMREAEARAVRALGAERMRLYVGLHDELIAALSREFEKGGIRHAE